MKHERNVDGLRQNAQKKRKEAIARTEAGIRQLIKEGKPVNFNTVADAAQVSTAWLYRECDIKARIEQLRSQSTAKKKSVTASASDASHAAIVRTLKDRIQKVEAENRGLREHIEVLQGQVLELSAVKRENITLKAENAKLKSQFITQPSSVPNASNPTPTAMQYQQPTQLRSEFQAELEQLGVKLNSGLVREMRNASEDVIQNAIAALRQRQSMEVVKNPAGFLRTAIAERWTPNEKSQQQSELALFQEWINLARTLGLVIASQDIEGVLYIYTNNGECLPFQEISLQYPLDRLRAMLAL